MPYVREVAAAIYDAGYRKSAENVKGIFVSEWDGGIKVETSCMVNLKTRQVYEIEQCSDNTDMFENFETEYILLNDERYPVFEQDELSEDDKTSFWY